jgi:hypothetical protein
LQKRARRSNYATGVNSIALFSKDHKDVSSKGRVSSSLGFCETGIACPPAVAKSSN